MKDQTYYSTYYQPEHETAKAVKDAMWGWMPKSQVHVATNSDGITFMFIPAWLKMKVAGRSLYYNGKMVWEKWDGVASLPKEIERLS